VIAPFLIRERNGMDMMTSFMLFLTLESVLQKHISEILTEPGGKVRTATPEEMIGAET